MVNYHEKKRLNMPKNLNATIDDHDSQRDKNPSATAEEQVIDSIVGHDKNGEDWKYLMRWY